MLKVVAALIFDGKRLLICKRPKNKALALLWEFPGGKLENGESGVEALKRECMEELSVDVEVMELFDEIQHDYDDFSVHISFYVCKIMSGTLSKNEHEELKWVQTEELLDYDFCPADFPVVKRLYSGQ